ncbi:DUF29 domain-containing protein [Methylobacterium oryzisoli]|uniref:DUF29 domain-containing protein n=1 Tax=Methylobacterium oryzisoli TaxID=3385502 RepID=UPI003891EA89
MDQPTLYEDDIVTWAEQQASALRALALRPDLSNALDWEAVAEEIESVGLSHVTAFESKLRLVLVHLLKYLSAPEAPSAHHWRSEIIAFQIAARAAFARSMRQRLDLAGTWEDAQRQAEASLLTYGDRLVGGLPQEMPFSLDDLLQKNFDPDAMLVRLAASLAKPSKAD